MHFIMFERTGYNELYACLINDEGLAIIQSQIINNSREFRGDFDAVNRLGEEIASNIFASIIFKTPRPNTCRDGYELVAWSSSQKGMGKLLLMHVLNQGIKLVADRRTVSQDARDAIIKMANSAIGNQLVLAPLDNKDNPVTNDKSDDCQTYTPTGGYIKSDMTFLSKIDVMNPEDLSVLDYMDFAVYNPNPTNYPETKVSQDEYDYKTNDSQAYALKHGIFLHFYGKVKSVSPEEGNSSKFKSFMKESKIKKIISDSLIKHIKVLKWK